jgi:hypothetical protein
MFEEHAVGREGVEIRGDVGLRVSRVTVQGLGGRGFEEDVDHVGRGPARFREGGDVSRRR